MDNQKNEQVIFVKDLFFAAFYQWRRIIAAAMIFAVLFGALSIFAQKSAIKNSPSADSIQKTYAKYEQKKAALDNNVTWSKSRVDAQEKYMQESIVMQIDPQQVYQANFSLAITSTALTVETEAADGTDNSVALILNAYKTFLNSNDIITAIAEEMGTKSQYIRELISFKIDGTSAEMLVVSINYVSADGAQKILDLFLSYLDDATAQVEAEWGAHTCKLINSDVITTIVTSIADKQTDAAKQLSTLQKNVTTATEARDELVAPTASVPVMSKKKALIVAFIGAVIGAFFVVGMAWFKHISGSALYSARILKNKTGIKILGCLPDDSKKNAIDRWFRKLEGRSLDDKHLPIVAATVNNCFSGKKLLIVGQGAESDMETIAASLKKFDIQTVIGGNLPQRADTLEELPTCDAVLLVERCGVSHYANIDKTCERISDQDKPLIGCVVFGG